MDLCPCGSELNYSLCCEPLILGNSKADSAEALLRSRYTAHCKRAIDYLGTTVLPSQLKRHDPEAVRQWAESTEWNHIDILQQKKVEGDPEITWIEFKAFYKKFGDLKEHHELAKFVKQDGLWYFDDQQDDRREPERREEPKIGRNDPCLCNSGMKYKKCCGR